MTDRERLELARRSYATWSAGDVRDGRILSITQTDDPPPGWDEARPLP